MCSSDLSEIVKWKVATQEVVDRAPTFYSIGHLLVPGGGTRKPTGKYVVAMNKITKDRYLGTGPELTQSAQLYDITGPKMKLLLDFPTEGEPHYAQAILASKIKDRQVKFFKLADNKHPMVSRNETETGAKREGKVVHIKMTSIRSHFAPDNIEGVTLGDTRWDFDGQAIFKRAVKGMTQRGPRKTGPARPVRRRPRGADVRGNTEAVRVDGRRLAFASARTGAPITASASS